MLHNVRLDKASYALFKDYKINIIYSIIKKYDKYANLHFDKFCKKKTQLSQISCFNQKI